MTAETDYRHQALQIRQSARARLLEIRQDRLLREQTSGGTDLDWVEDRSQKRLRRAERLAELGRQAQAERRPVAQDATSSATFPVAGMRNQPEFSARWRETDTSRMDEMFGPPQNSSPPGLDNLSPEAHFGPHSIDAVQHADAAGPEEIAPLTLSADMRVGLTEVPAQGDIEGQVAIAPVPTLGAAELMALPGAGPGLIWMLQQCGISTLADLAETDAAALVPKLGLVGQIVDIPAWQRFARRQGLRAQRV